MMTLDALRDGFTNPPVEYSPIPFWFLNADMDHDELARQLRLMHAVGIGTVVLHGRQWHTVEYLSDEWFAGIRHCVETCASLGMKAWLYDEDNWPSGYAGGATLAAYPGGQAKNLAMVAAAQDGEDVVATVGESVFVMRPTPWHPAYNEGWYTDLLDLRATEAFIECTHERYAEVLGEHLGSTVTAVIGCALLDYGLGRYAARAKRKTLPVLIAAAIHIALLGVFKYAGFFTDTLNAVARLSLPVPAIALLGSASMAKAFHDFGGVSAWFAMEPAGSLSLPAAIGICVGSFISGGTLTPDFTRYARTSRISVSATVIAFLLGNSLMFLFGAVASAFYQTNDISLALKAQGLIAVSVLVVPALAEIV